MRKMFRKEKTPNSLGVDRIIMSVLLAVPFVSKNDNETLTLPRILGSIYRADQILYMFFQGWPRFLDNGYDMCASTNDVQLGN